jgi:1-deoxy-D-xylulose-5-phosphate synthase
MYDFYPKDYNNVGLDSSIDWIDYADFTLGNSLGIAEGIAIAEPDKKIFVLISDSQLNMGNTLEAIVSIGFLNLKNIILAVDYNDSCSKGVLSEVLEPNLNIFKSNWNIIYNKSYEYNDLNFNQDKPNVIIFDTIKNVYPKSDYKIKL